MNKKPHKLKKLHPWGYVKQTVRRKMESPCKIDMKKKPICVCGHEKESHVKKGCLFQEEEFEGWRTCYCGKYRLSESDL